MRLKEVLNPLFLDIIDESHLHGKEKSHYKIIVVSEKFVGMPLLERHRLLYSLLKELDAHALALHPFTPDEWKESPSAPQSPLCHRQKSNPAS